MAVSAHHTPPPLWHPGGNFSVPCLLRRFQLVTFLLPLCFLFLLLFKCQENQLVEEVMQCSTHLLQGVLWLKSLTNFLGCRGWISGRWERDTCTGSCGWADKDTEFDYASLSPGHKADLPARGTLSVAGKDSQVQVGGDKQASWEPSPRPELDFLWLDVFLFYF